MSGSIVLALRLITAFALIGFLGWALLFLYREVYRQGLSLERRKIPEISISILHDHSAPTAKFFSQAEIMLGRDPACDIPLMDDLVSIRHAQLTYHHAQWWLEDLTSTNGTTLNDTLVTMPTVITAGDEIKCGSTQLIVSFSENIMDERAQRLLHNDK